MVSKQILEEWIYLYKNKRLLILLILVPFAFIFLFGSTYSSGKIRSMPTVYLDEDHTVLSRQVIQAFHASETFDLVGSPLTEEAVTQQIEHGEAVVGIVIPAGFEKKVTRGEQGDLMTIVDGSNIMLVNSALNAANEIVQTISTEIAMKRVEAKGLNSNSVLSLQFGYRMLYNPGLSYGIFMPLGLLGAIIQQVVLLGMSLCIVRYKEMKDPIVGVKPWQELGAWRWLYAKAVPYFLIGLFHLGLSLVILVKIYQFPSVGSAGWLLILSVLFMLSLIGLGNLVSAFTPNSLQATQISMLLAVLSFPLSGYTWPFIAMPKWLTVVGHFFPLTYFLDGLKEIALKGNGWEAIKLDLGGLLLIAVFTTWVTMTRLLWKRSYSTTSNQGIGLS